MRADCRFGTSRLPPSQPLARFGLRAHGQGTKGEPHLIHLPRVVPDDPSSLPEIDPHFRVALTGAAASTLIRRAELSDSAITSADGESANEHSWRLDL